LKYIHQLLPNYLFLYLENETYRQLEDYFLLQVVEVLQKILDSYWLLL